MNSIRRDVGSKGRNSIRTYFENTELRFVSPDTFRTSTGPKGDMDESVGIVYHHSLHLYPSLKITHSPR